MRARLLSATALLVPCACGAPELGPLARIALTPALLCEGQPATAVILDGSASLPAAGDDRLDFTWELSRPAEELVRGDYDEALLVVRLPTRTPIGVSLTVRAGDGTSNRREQVLPLTRSALQSCAAGCAEGELCAVVAGTGLCTLDRTCNDDEECGCLRCASDDRGRRLCLPR